MQSKTVTRRSLNLMYLRDALDLELCAQTLRTNPENCIFVYKKVLLKRNVLLPVGDATLILRNKIPMTPNLIVIRIFSVWMMIYY